MGGRVDTAGDRKGTSMQIDLATVTSLGVIQTGLMALVLLVATRRYAGVAGSSLRLRALALGLEATGWCLFGLRGQFSDWLTVVLANALILISYALTVRALRLLLGVPQHRVLVIAVCLLGWLVQDWFALVQLDYPGRVWSMSVPALFCIALLLQPLASSWRRKGSLAGRTLFATLTVSAGLVLWRALALLFDSTPQGLTHPTWANTLYVLLSSTQPLFTSVGFLLLYNETMQAKLQCLARIDPLTGVNNRLALGEWAQRLFRRARRTQRSFAALMLDADHFKSINDRFGHAGGDRVLLSLVTSIHASIGANDVIGRVGGEEFVLLAPDTDMSGALALGERVRAAVEGGMLRLGLETLSLTVSIGVSVSLAGEDDVDALLARADAALYAAKRAGRNCVMGSDLEQALAFEPMQPVAIDESVRELRA